MIAFSCFYEVSVGVTETSYSPVSKIQKRINEPQIGLPTEKGRDRISLNYGLLINHLKMNIANTDYFSSIYGLPQWSCSLSSFLRLH